jgi:hypothetical protein
MRVLVVDGPLAGKVQEVARSDSFLAIDTPERPNYFDFHLTEQEAYQAQFSTVTYRIHRLLLLGETFLIASTQPIEPRAEDVFRHLLSQKTRRMRGHTSGTQRRRARARPPRTGHERQAQGNPAW